ncbi:hypothetical protein EU555_29905 [Methylobacterium nonmethylotrophicum]|uniref:Uncharacterized protein n=1 Tax=Methylobacterium nonmethylotrophicum TaxID=1141884 RepID=A0A4Z0NHB4_9HYPH|nr:hypothetical protein EU555_29905 [Methylobacterium nonmethylotrophicum]
MIGRAADHWTARSPAVTRDAQGLYRERVRSHPRPHPEVPGDRRSRGLEGGLQIALRLLEASFEVSRSPID